MDLWQFYIGEFSFMYYTFADCSWVIFNNKNKQILTITYLGIIGIITCNK